MKYGDLPRNLGEFKVDCNEMMFYQYLPIKMRGTYHYKYESRLEHFNDLILMIISDFIEEFGIDRYVDSYIYITLKHAYQVPGCSFNREGYHSDGFLTDDINYIWYSESPTIFNTSDFKLTLDDSVAMKEMEEQADEFKVVIYPNYSILRLNQYNIHKVNNSGEGMRTFLKVSFSKDKYDLIGNSHNYEIEYNWDMKPRKKERNIPQSKII